MLEVPLVHEGVQRVVQCRRTGHGRQRRVHVQREILPFAPQTALRQLAVHGLDGLVRARGVGVVAELPAVGVVRLGVEGVVVTHRVAGQRVGGPGHPQAVHEVDALAVRIGVSKRMQVGGKGLQRAGLNPRRDDDRAGDETGGLHHRELRRPAPGIGLVGHQRVGDAPRPVAERAQVAVVVVWEMEERRIRPKPRSDAAILVLHAGPHGPDGVRVGFPATDVARVRRRVEVAAGAVGVGDGVARPDLLRVHQLVPDLQGDTVGDGEAGGQGQDVGQVIVDGADLLPPVPGLAGVGIAEVQGLLGEGADQAGADQQRQRDGDDEPAKAQDLAGWWPAFERDKERVMFHRWRKRPPFTISRRLASIITSISASCTKQGRHECTSRL